MWFQARQEEKKMRHIMVDHKKRIDRRRMFYEKIKKDPVEFMQLHARSYKIHVDASIASAAESQAILRPWQGDCSILIDRFDVRSHLDAIPENKCHETDHDSFSGRSDRLADYERYRVLVFNDFEKISEDKFLRLIYIEENGGTNVNTLVKAEEQKKKKLASKKAAISFDYTTETEDQLTQTEKSKTEELLADDIDGSSESDYEPDFDKRLDVSELSADQCNELNQIATKYGMKMGDFIKCMWEEYEEQARVQNMKEIEDERLALAGKHSRRERKLLKELRIRDRGMVSNPLDLLRIKKINPESRQKAPLRYSRSRSSSSGRSSSRSRSRSRGRQSIHKETIQFITTFGDGRGDEESDDEKDLGTSSRIDVSGNDLAPKKSSMSAASPFSAAVISSAAVDKRKRHQESVRSSDGLSGRLSSSGSKDRRRDRRSRSKSRRRSSRDEKRRRPSDDWRYTGRSRSKSHDRIRHRSRSRSSRSRKRYSKSRSRSQMGRRSKSKDILKGRANSPNGSGLRRLSNNSSRPEEYKSNNRDENDLDNTASTSNQKSGLKTSSTHEEDSDLSLLSVNSEMSDSEQERRQVENTRRRLKKTKRALHLRSFEGSKPIGSSVGALDSINDSTKPKTLSALDKLKLQTQKALKKNLARDKEEARQKMEEARREQQERDEEIRELALQMRTKERERRELSPSRRHRRRSSSSRKISVTRKRSRSRK